jgi:hypothetical protein
MTEHVNAYFRGLDGISEVRLRVADAVELCHDHPIEWALMPASFARAPAGFVFSEGDGGGRGRIAGASVRAE